MGFELPEPFESIDNELGYAQFGGHLVECVTLKEDLPFAIRNGGEQSSLHAGRTLRPIVAMSNSGKNDIHHVIKAGSLILFKCLEQYPDRFWVNGCEYHVIQPEDIVLQIAYEGEIEDDEEDGDDDEWEDEEDEDTYGEVLEPGEIIADYEEL